MPSSKNEIIEHPFILSLLFIMVIYLPVNYLGFLNFDDIDVVNRVHDRFSDIKWSTLFFRSSATRYYRPLLEILCYMDYALWGLSVRAWHLTNYIIHIFNATLVYMIALKWFEFKKDARLWSAIAMLFFALNPLTCESVAWISGRSDLAGTFFSLLAVYAYYLKTPVRFILTPLAILAGLLCKENALAVVPIIVLLEGFQNYKNRRPLKDSIKNCLLWVFVVFIPLFVYFFLRTNGWEHYSYKYIKAVAPMVNQAQDTVDRQPFSDFLYLFPVIAFYLKKLIIPFPLNFAITKINTFLYSFLFLMISIVNLVCLLKKKWAFPFFISLLVISFSPALIVTLGGIAWLSLAERYVYLSLSVMSIGVASFLYHLYDHRCLDAKKLIGACTVLVLIFSAATLQRQFAFDSNKSIWTQTLKTNPDSSMVLFMYGGAVGGQEGQAAYHKALANPDPFPWRTKALFNIAQYESSAGNYDKAVGYIDNALNINESYSNLRIAATILLNAGKAENPLPDKYVYKAIEYLKKADAKKRTVFVLYKIASFLKHLNETEEANQLFMEIIGRYPDSKYAAYSKKQISK